MGGGQDLHRSKSKQGDDGYLHAAAHLGLPYQGCREGGEDPVRHNVQTRGEVGSDSSKGGGIAVPVRRDWLVSRPLVLDRRTAEDGEEDVDGVEDGDSHQDGPDGYLAPAMVRADTQEEEPDDPLGQARDDDIEDLGEPPVHDCRSVVLGWDIFYVRPEPVGHGDEAKGSEGGVQGLRRSHHEKLATLAPAAGERAGQGGMRSPA